MPIEPGSAEWKIQRAHFYIMNNPMWVAYAGIVMTGTTEIVDDPAKVPTAVTNGWSIKYNRAFIEALPEEQVRAVVIHENKHKAYRHHAVWKNLARLDADRTNQATDYVINLEIKNAGDPGVVLPLIALVDERFKGMGTDQVWKLLPPSPPNGTPKGCGLDWDDPPFDSPEEERKQAEAIDAALRHGSTLAGKAGGKTFREFDELLKVEIDPAELLRLFVQENTSGSMYASWRRPNRRYLAQNLYMPSMLSENVDEPIIWIDTSGSISKNDLGRMLTQALAIIKAAEPRQVHVIYWDHHVAAHEIYPNNLIGKILHSTSPKGGGGTTPSCMTAYLEEKKLKPTLNIVFTDGYVGNDWGGKWPSPVVWCIKDNKAARPTVGTTVHF